MYSELYKSYNRIGDEDGLAFGSVHPSAALEVVLWLIKTDFKGHIYFDTFPRNEDPVMIFEIELSLSLYVFALSNLLSNVEITQTLCSWSL